MAGKTKKSTKNSKTPRRARTHRRRSAWDEDLGIGYATYDHEEDYVSRADLDDEKLDNLRNFNKILATSPLFVDDYV